MTPFEIVEPRSLRGRLDLDRPLCSERHPKAVIDRIYREAASSLRLADIKERFSVPGSEPVSMPPVEPTAHVKRDAERYLKVAQNIGLQAQYGQTTSFQSCTS